MEFVPKLVTWCFAESNPEAERAQMQLLFAELKRIEGQQQMLKSAVAQNKMLVVMPPPGFNAEDPEDEYAEEVVAKPDPDRFVPSGMLISPPCVFCNSFHFLTW